MMRGPAAGRAPLTFWRPVEPRHPRFDRSHRYVSAGAVRAWLPWLASLVAMAIGSALIATTPSERVPVGFRLEDLFSYLLLPLSSTTVGALVAWRRPHNAVGWLLASVGWISCWQCVTVGYAIHGSFSEARLPSADVSAWAFSWSGIWLGLAVGHVLVRFPDGRIADRRGWFSVALFLVSAVLATSALALRPGPLFLFRDVENPFGVAGVGGVLDTAFGTALLLYVVAFGLGISALIKRWRRALGVERQQFKWFMAGVLLTLALIVAAALFFVLDVPIAKFVISNGVAAIPVAVGIAILRHRLYDIDLLIKRTLVYGATSAAVAASFFIGIVALQALLRPLTAGSEIAIAGSTLVSFALFQPVRRRVQQAVNHRFDRSRYDAERTLDAFADQLRDEVDVDALRGDLMDVVRQTMGPASVSLWLRERAR